RRLPGHLKLDRTAQGVGLKTHTATFGKESGCVNARTGVGEERLRASVSSAFSKSCALHSPDFRFTLRHVHCPRNCPCQGQNLVFRETRRKARPSDFQKNM